MSDSHTVLPTTKLLNLIGVRADANSITLSAKTSARTVRCPICVKRSGRIHSRYTRRWPTCPGRECQSPFTCASVGSSAARNLPQGDLRGAFARPRGPLPRINAIAGIFYGRMASFPTLSDFRYGFSDIFMYVSGSLGRAQAQNSHPRPRRRAM